MIYGVSWIGCRIVLGCWESGGADRFERNMDMLVYVPDASSSRSSRRSLVAPRCLDGPQVPGLLSYSEALVTESGILLDSGNTINLC